MTAPHRPRLLLLIRHHHHRLVRLSRVDLQLQLAPLRPNELLYMSQGKASLSTAELLSCFDWDFAASPAAGFGEGAHRCAARKPNRRRALARAIHGPTLFLSLCKRRGPPSLASQV